jgi:hypothetical protein
MSLDNTSIQALLATSVKAGRAPSARTRDPFPAAAAFADAEVDFGTLSRRHGVTITVRGATFARARGECSDDVVQLIVRQTNRGVMTIPRAEDREPGPAVRTGRQADSIPVYQRDPQRAIWMPVHRP